MRNPILFICILLLSSTFVKAMTYRISSENEFKDILPKLIAGDEVIIANGNYNNWAIEIKRNGTAAKPILIKAENTGKVLFSGETDRTIFKLTGEFITLSGLTFNECTLVKAEGKNGLLIELKDSKNCRITDCTFTKNIVKAQFMPLVVFSGKGTANKIDHCNFISNVDNQDVQVKVVKDNFPTLTEISYNSFSNKSKVGWKNGNGGECVQIGQDPILLGNMAPKTIVTYNRFVHCDGENEVISNKSSSNSYTHNYFEANDGELVMRGGHDCTISDNTFEGGTGGIRINGSGHTITNNKINNIKTAIRLMYGMAKGKEETGFYIAASNCIIKNNKISNANTGILIGDSKNADWTGKFDTVRYPSRVMQDVAPFDNEIGENEFKATKKDVVTL